MLARTQAAPKLSMEKAASVLALLLHQVWVRESPRDGRLAGHANRHPIPRSVRAQE